MPTLPITAKVYTLFINDNASWISAGEYELPAATLQNVDSDIFFERAFYGRYIRINVTSCYNANGTAGFYQCGISELNIYGKKGEDQNDQKE